MKAMLMRQPGGPEVLTETDLPVPELRGPTDLLVRLRAAGVNPVDTKIRGKGPLLPEVLTAVLGCDGAGVVEAVGDAVTRFKPGDAVWYCHGGLGGPHGNYAEYAVVDEAIAQPKPVALGFVQAAAAPLVLITAWEALHDRAHIQADQTVLIHAGAGGVGHVAIQLARIAGARVATTVSSEAKGDFARALGAEFVINYRNEDVAGAIADWTRGRGVDICFDTVGPEVFVRSIETVAVYGDLVTILDPGTVNLKEARTRNLRISLELMLTPQLRNLPDGLAHQGEILRRCGELCDAGDLRVEVADTYPLERAADAHRRLEAGGMQGKLVLTMPGAED
ncbi:MAG: zinc-dependent alcohol dehydrogenase family protein [Thiohalocapsa sp.]|jgi:NADPH2:quinone reductase|uniref:zinc-dependent alcohol dehydrogenase family protein n=1 Tax=Thiohalocapsa sp. TaxID=2497641 RepID=UPI0025FB7F72|nr:zinc-dependent alcohol dehydrogenase family protein [Thiohalocapsa sp.]MCG6940442.1 zinc-dependent alcohol dehydrogenase family protein [Thiohalocapsa sp.]